MPPERGAVKKSSKTEARKDSKLSKPTRESRTGDDNNARSTRGKQEPKTKDDSSSRRRDKSKTEEMTLKGSISKRSKIDSEKLKDVKHDLNKDLNKAKETLSRNRASLSHRQPVKSTTTPVKASSDVTIRNRVSTRSNSIENRNSKSSSNVSTSKRPTQSVERSKPDLLGRGDTPSRSRLDKTSSRQSQVATEKRSKHSKTDQVPQKLNRERTRTRTLSPNEVKIVKSLQPIETEAPKPQTSKGVTQKLRKNGVTDAPVASQASDDKDDSYEDDFEDYESDFEEDIADSSDSTSSASEMLSENESSSSDEGNASEQAVVEVSNKPIVEEEKKMDSGNYDLTESKRKGREIQMIKEALEKENASISSPKHGMNLNKQDSVTHDEGFEEEKIDEKRGSVIMKKVGFINFANAKKRMEEQKVSAKTKKRSEELLQMIDLDTVEFSLLDLAPVPYEVFMKSYGRSNTQQASVQTNEDDLSEETQTEEITSRTMWTQYPLAYRPVKDKEGKVIEYINTPFHVEVGCDKEENPDLWKDLIKYDAQRLNEFILLIGKKMLKFLEMKSGVRRRKLTASAMTSAVSNGFFSLATESVTFLKGRPVTKLSFCNRRPTMMMTVHGQSNESNVETDAFLKRSMICIWNVMQPIAPEKILVCSEEISSACFHGEVDYLVFAGLWDGAICVWDLQEPASTHRLVSRQTRDWIIRSPTYSTAEVLKNDGHLCQVVSVQSVMNENEPPELKSFVSPIQVCSVDVTGIAIIWTAIRSAKEGLASGASQQDLGLAHWGRVRLVRSTSLKLFEGLNLNKEIILNMECRAMQMDLRDGTNFYVCTNSGHTLHSLITGYKPHPKVYFSGSNGAHTPATCIECLVDHHILVGHEGGIVKLFCRGTSRPLATFAATGDPLGQGPSILSIHWSPVHPCQFFVLDRKSRIHVWNLIESDIHPTEIISFNKEVLSVSLSPNIRNNIMYLAIGTANGDVELHEMKTKFCYESQAIFDQELDQFKTFTKSL